MKEQLKIALVQTALKWEDPEANVKHIARFLAECDADTNIIVLPEMFSTGFTMNPAQVAESMEDTTVQWMKSEAARYDAAIVGSLVIQEKNMFHNRLIFAEPSGKIWYYDKRHTFTLAGEDKVYTAGTDRLIVEYLGWRICPLICYDLRFPVWARNNVNYQVLLYVANWPAPRIEAWDTLLKARAIENMCYCIGVNRIGSDENNHLYTGHSAVYDALGNRMVFMEKEEIQHLTISGPELLNKRDKFKFLEDRDIFNLIK